jgi:hypothetical protein
MQSRPRLLMGATALLYLGPLLAGLGGFGWAVVPVFVAIFLLWLLILRPYQWPRRPSEWQTPKALATLGTQAVVQLLLVTMLVGLGRGIGSMWHFVAPFPAMLPIAISFLSVPLSRLVWNPWKVAEMDQFLDTALRQIHNAPERYREGRIALAHRMLAQLADLPDDTPAAEITRLLDAIGMHTDEDALRVDLLERVQAGMAGRAVLTALVLHTTDGRQIEAVDGDGPTLALIALSDQSHDPALIALYANRLTLALREDADIWGKCPSVSLLDSWLEAYADTEADLPLRQLIDATNRAAPEDGLA